jgi:hypothetical protein
LAFEFSKMTRNISIECSGISMDFALFTRVATTVIQRYKTSILE